MLRSMRVRARKRAQSVAWHVARVVLAVPTIPLSCTGEMTRACHVVLFLAGRRVMQGRLHRRRNRRERTFCVFVLLGKTAGRALIKKVLFGSGLKKEVRVASPRAKPRQ